MADKIGIIGRLVAGLVSSRLFALYSLIFTFLCYTAWLAIPQYTGWWLLMAGAPWVLRFILSGKLFKRTPFDLWIAFFLLTALVGVWAAYNREAGWAKFITLFGGVLLFYFLTVQPQENIKDIGWGFFIIGAGLATSFLLSDNFLAQSADLSLITNLGIWWAVIRPFTLPFPLQPNTVGGILAVLLPLQLAASWLIWRKSRNIIRIVILASVLITAAGLLLTSSRGAWIALLVASILAIMLSWVKQCAPSSRKLIYFGLSILILTLAISAIYVIGKAGGLRGLVHRLPGQESTATRLDIYKNTLWLVDEYLITGGGLDSFAGLYSRYMLLIPFFMFGYSHNLFLDVALEQGLFGLIALAGMLWITAKILYSNINSRNDSFKPYRIALLICLGVFFFHGWIDDAFYGGGGTPLLFMISGVTVLITGNTFNWKKHPNQRYYNTISLIVLGGIFILLVFQWKPVLAKFTANLGAVMMSRWELSLWPETLQKLGSDPAGEANISTFFDHALNIDPPNRTARYRLGLLAFEQGNYKKAETLLEPAYLQSPGHRGLKKALALAYAWQGNLASAQILLTDIPEARQEMQTYAWWWQTQNRQDLSAYASRLADLLSSQSQ